MGRRAAWIPFSAALLSIILVPFFFFESQITGWVQTHVATRQGGWGVGLVLAGLLASDVLLPVPSSIVSTAAGALLGVWGGALASWTGMTAGCLIGYWLGSRAGRPGVKRLAGSGELDRVSRAAGRFGHWVIIVFRAVPVLAEASVIFAGVVRIPPGRFVALTALSNLGISLTYAAAGAFSVSLGSFLLAVAGSVMAPLVAMLAVRLLEKK